MDPLLFDSGLELARKIKSREITSTDAVEAHIRHIELVNPIVNAMVKDRFNKARAEARRADEEFKEKGPDGVPVYHGVPCTIKESFQLTGMPQTSGLVARRDRISEQDATTVARMREAGAIPLGVTNVPELCMWMETNNLIYGRSNNPYNREHIVGGSSGGEGCIIGAGGSPFGLGADIGGSIRMPAFFNGVFGHKASSNLIPNTGQYPISFDGTLNYLATGPICRRAEDLWPLVKLMAGPDGVDPNTREQPLGDPGTVDLTSLTVVDIEDNGHTPVSLDLRLAQRRVTDHLVKNGARLVVAKPDLLRKSFDIWSSSLSHESKTSFVEMMGDGRQVSPIIELFKWFFQRSNHTFPAIMLGITEAFEHLFPGRIRKFFRLGQELREEMNELVGPKGIFLFPSHAYPAPRHNYPLMRPFNFVYTGILNIMEMPVTQVPLGLNSEGLPLGVQVGATHGNDHLTVAVAMELERAFGGWVPPDF
ncbi:amidase [bacterium]|nr:amidase [bacterium]